MILIATETILRDRGTGYEKVCFTKGNAYKYFPLDSTDNHHHLKGERGTEIFNNEQFTKNFKTANEWNKERTTIKD